MFKKVFVILFVVMLIFVVRKLSFAMICGSHSGYRQTAQAEPGEHRHMQTEAATGATTKEAVDAGNKICPVSGEKIDEKTKATYEYKGKIYNFCCAMCIDDFKKDPDKYIKKIEDELKGVPEAKPNEHMTMP